MKLEQFSRRVRADLETKHMTVAQLAEKSDLDASLVSKLLTETDTSRREPRVEHIIAIARALDKTPHELASGTTAEAVLGDWVPRAELEKESAARVQAQARAGNLETELAASRAEVTAAKNELTRYSQQVADYELKTKREISSLKVTCAGVEAQLGACTVERDKAVAEVVQLKIELASTQSQFQKAHSEMVEARGSQAAAWMTAFVGTFGGYAIGAATAKPAKRQRKA